MSKAARANPIAPGRTSKSPDPPRLGAYRFVRGWCHRMASPTSIVAGRAIVGTSSIAKATETWFRYLATLRTVSRSRVAESTRLVSLTDDIAQKSRRRRTPARLWAGPRTQQSHHVPRRIDVVHSWTCSPFALRKSKADVWSRASPPTSTSQGRLSPAYQQASAP